MSREMDEMRWETLSSGLESAEDYKLK